MTERIALLLKKQFWELFHRRWGSDKESKEYDKLEWVQLETLALALMPELRGPERAEQ